MDCKITGVTPVILNQSLPVGLAATLILISSIIAADTGAFVGGKVSPLSSVDLLTRNNICLPNSYHVFALCVDAWTYTLIICKSKENLGGCVGRIELISPYHHSPE